MILMTHYNIQDKDIIDTTSMALVDPENYNRKTSFTKQFGNAKTSLKNLEPFQILFSDKNMSEILSKDNITALFFNLDKLDMVPNNVLQSLILG